MGATDSGTESFIGRTVRPEYISPVNLITQTNIGRIIVYMNQSKTEAGLCSKLSPDELGRTRL